MSDNVTPPSAKSQRLKILALLQARGSVTNYELNNIAFRYSARIYELRQEGHEIHTVPIEGSLVKYVYRHPSTDAGAS